MNGIDNCHVLISGKIVFSGSYLNCCGWASCLREPFIIVGELPMAEIGY